MNNRADILNELKALAPILLQLKKHGQPVVVPEGYFASFADDTLSEIHSSSGILAGLEKEKISAPAGYFATFGDHIISTIKEEELVKTMELPKQQNKMFFLFSRVALAASIVGAVLLIRHIQQPILTVNDCTDGIACLTQEEIYDYMNTNSHEFDVQLIQETVKPVVDTIEATIDIETKDASKYIEENKLVLEIDDSSTDIF
jgi:hypothetical protein